MEFCLGARQAGVQAMISSGRAVLSWEPVCNKSPKKQGTELQSLAQFNSLSLYFTRCFLKSNSSIVYLYNLSLSCYLYIYIVCIVSCFKGCYMRSFSGTSSVCRTAWKITQPPIQTYGKPFQQVGLALAPACSLQFGTGKIILPSGKQTQLLKMTIYSGFTH